MVITLTNDTDPNVAPFTGAWIEIARRYRNAGKYSVSHPSRVRGLKFNRYICKHKR